jgi:hypothetical protein
MGQVEKRAAIIETPARSGLRFGPKHMKCSGDVGFATACKPCADRNVLGIYPAFPPLRDKNFADSIEVVY